ncbi:GntR family transcriptional regulator [Micromonospora chokoriensis]|uniref:GntR family transcriptional regulator n=1 Tax=Micromonospora chokoriensis TaxID=356851 RepID=UPI0004C3BA7A|nr:GntR family transcriptional regulator [Micromonospora chokoriensis]
MIDARSGVPAWRQLADDLRARIGSGEFAPGAALPSEAQLGQQYGLGRTTVRRAVAALRAEGVVVVQHGYGMRVPVPAEPQIVRPEPGSVVSTRMPTPAERAAFGMADGVPVLVITGPDGLPEAYPGDQVVVPVD